MGNVKKLIISNKWQTVGHSHLLSRAALDRVICTSFWAIWYRATTLWRVKFVRWSRRENTVWALMWRKSDTLPWRFSPWMIWFSTASISSLIWKHVHILHVTNFYQILTECWLQTINLYKNFRKWNFGFLKKIHEKWEALGKYDKS